MPDPANLTELIRSADHGDAQAIRELYDIVEKELRTIAAAAKRNAGAGANYWTTALIDSAFRRLLGDKVQWEPGDRRKFYGFAAIKIHDILIDWLRKEGRNEAEPLPDELEGSRHLADGHSQLMIDLKAALLRMQQISPKAYDDAIVFRIRYFLDCTFDEVAEIMGMPKTSVHRSYERSQKWLQEELKEYRRDTREKG